MKIRIKQYPLAEFGDVKLNIPYGSQILSVKNCKDVPTIFAIIDEDCTVCEKTFRIFATGSVIDEKELKRLKFVETVQDEWGMKEWHIFEVGW
jgi:hypothetical protein